MALHAAHSAARSVDCGAYTQTCVDDGVDSRVGYGLRPCPRAYCSPGAIIVDSASAMEGLKVRTLPDEVAG